MPSIRLRTEPTVHQSDVILNRVQRALVALGINAVREQRETVRIRLPWLWQARKLDPLYLAWSGKVFVSAGWGEPRRLRYELNFLPLHAVGIVATVALVFYGWGWPRMVLLGALLWLWVAILLLIFIASRRMRALLTRCAREIVQERPPDGPTEKVS